MRKLWRMRNRSPGERPDEQPLAPPDAAALIRSSGYFDAAWYADQLDEPIPGDAVDHYLATGAGLGLSPHPLFDPATYVTRHPEAADGPALVHFLRRATPLLDLTPTPGTPADTVAGRTSIIVATDGSPRATARCVRVLADRTGGDHEIVVVDNAATGVTPYVCLLLQDELPRVQVVRAGQRTANPLARNLGAQVATGDVLVFLTVFVAVERGWIGPLRAALDAGASAVQPRVLLPDGTISSTGLAVDAGGLHVALAGLPGDDPGARIAARRVAADYACLAVHAAPFAAVGGFPAQSERTAAADLCLRLAAAGHGATRYEPASSVVNSRRPGRTSAADEQAQVALADRVRTLSLPVVRTHARAADGLRWAIKVSPPFQRRRRWGDFHFAHSLAAALERLGQDVVVDTHEAWYRESAERDDVVLVLRGLEAYRPTADHINLLWVISHSDEVPAQEWATYDHAFVAAVRPPRSAQGVEGIRIEPLLQATDAHRFVPGAAEAELRHDVLFVGNSRWHLRPIVRDALAADLPLSVYGDGWTDFIPDEVLRGDLIANEQLPRYYRSAGVVLNDHWDDMRRDGLLSNRLFDLAACAAVFVTDVVEGMDAVFGDALHTYREPDELGPLVRRLLAGPDDRERRLELSEHIRSQHSFDVRAQRLLEVARTLTRSRGG